jgi:site-specific recombinase XerC
MYAGTRIAEVAALDVADVRLSARKGGLHLVGKGKKSRIMPAHAKLREALAAWLAERPARTGADGSALFLSVRGTRMTTGALADVIAAVVAASGRPADRGRVAALRVQTSWWVPVCPVVTT